MINLPKEGVSKIMLTLLKEDSSLIPVLCELEARIMSRGLVRAKDKGGKPIDLVQLHTKEYGFLKNKYEEII